MSVIHHRYRRDRGTVLVGVLLALWVFSLLIGIAFSMVHMLPKFRETLGMRMEALLQAVNTMETLKREAHPVSSFREEGRYIVRWNVQEFTPTTFLLEVSVEDKKGRVLLTLRTLRRKGLPAP